MKQYPCTFLLLATVITAFAVEVATGAIGDNARLLSLSAIQDDGTLGTQY